MNGSTRLARSAAALAAAALILTACSSGSPEPAPTESSAEVVVPEGVAQDVAVGGFNLNTLDPGAPTGFNGPGEAVVQNVFGQLISPPAEPGGEYVPNLATAYEFNEDSTRLTLTLREGVTFTDGTPFDAEAVKFNYDRYTSTNSRVSQYVASLESTEVVDPLTVRLNFSSPATNFLDVLALTVGGSIQSPTAIQENGESYGLHIVGAGPFMIEAYTPGTQADLVPNPDFWDAEHTYLTRLTYLSTGSDPSVNYQQVVSGAIDVYQVNGVTSSPSVLNDAKSNTNIGMVQSDDNQYTFLPLNTQAAPFDDLDARKAIDHCTDRETLARTVTLGWGNPAWINGGSSTLYYPGGGYDSYPAKFPYPFDKEKGTALVEGIGGLQFTLHNMGGQYTVIANALAQMWKQNCGIEAAVETDQPPALATRLTAGNYEAVLTISGGLNDPSFFRTFQTDTPQAKYMGGADYPELAELISEANATHDEAELNRIWNDFWTLVNREAIGIPVLSGPIYYLQNQCLEGVSYAGSGGTYRHAFLTC